MTWVKSPLLTTCVAAVMVYFLVISAGMELDGSITKCRGVDIELTEEHFMHIDECLKEASGGNAAIKNVLDLDPTKMACFGKCVFFKKGLVDEKGKPHKEKIMGMIKDNLPKEIHADLDRRIETCLLPNTTDIIDPADETCVSYLPMMMCTHIAFMEECDN